MGAGRAVAPCRCHPTPQPSCFRSPAIRTEAGKPRFSPAKRCASPQTGIRSPLPAVLSLHLPPTAKAPRPVPGTTRDPTGKIAEGKSCRWGIGQADAPCGGAPYKKDPLALRAARGSRTIFGSGLLSHMTLCSIIGDGELNFRVRNGVGCTLSSMATKEIWQIY